MFLFLVVLDPYLIAVVVFAFALFIFAVFLADVIVVSSCCVCCLRDFLLLFLSLSVLIFRCVQLVVIHFCLYCFRSWRDEVQK